MKGIKKYTKSYDVTKQLAKEKLGKASNSADSEEIKFIKEKLHLIKWILKHSKIAGADYTHHNDVSNILADKESVFASVLTAMGEGGTIDAPIGSACTIVGNILKENSSADRTVSSLTKEHLIDTLAKIYEVDAKLVLECKERQEVARLQYESAQVKVKDNQKKGGKKLQEAEQELQQMKTNYESLTEELAFQCSTLIRKINDQLFPHLHNYVSAQAARYAKLAEQWRATQETVAHLASTPYQPVPHVPDTQNQSAHSQAYAHIYAQAQTHAQTQGNTQSYATNAQPQGNTQAYASNTQTQGNTQVYASAPPYDEPRSTSHDNNNNNQANNYSNSNTYNSNNSNNSPSSNNSGDGNPFEVPAMPALPSQMNFNQPANANHSTQSTNSMNYNYYPTDHDPFQQNVGSQPDPFSQPQQSNNIYSR